MSKEYIEAALTTESKAIPTTLDSGMMRLLHASMGMATEGSECLDIVKKAIFYGKDIDRAHFIEEMGDISWYMAIACNELGVTFEEIQETNIAKLMARYPEQFTNVAALERNLEAERQAMKEAQGNSE